MLELGRDWGGYNGMGLSSTDDVMVHMMAGPIWLFFGCRHRSQDWIFHEEMLSFLKEGILTELHTAFSRDNPEKKHYVQHRILEEGERLCKMLISVSEPPECIAVQP